MDEKGNGKIRKVKGKDGIYKLPNSESYR